jgi:hypothetical protein
LIGLSLILAIGSSLITGLPNWMMAASITVSILTTWAICGLGVGLGAISPRFHLANPTRIASGIGGVVFMLLGMSYLVAAMVMVAWPLMGLKDFFELGHWPSTRRLWSITALILLTGGLSALTHFLPMWLGRRALGRREA